MAEVILYGLQILEHKNITHYPLALLEYSQLIFFHRHRALSAPACTFSLLLEPGALLSGHRRCPLPCLLRPVERGFRGQIPFSRGKAEIWVYFCFFHFGCTLGDRWGGKVKALGDAMMWHWLLSNKFAMDCKKKKKKKLPNHPIQRDHRERPRKFSRWQTSWGSSRQPVSTTNHVSIKISWWFLLPAIEPPPAFKSSQQRPQTL